MAYEPAQKDSGDVRRRVEDKGGAFGDHGGATPRPRVHDITRIDEQSNGFRIHVELPPVDPGDVKIDITGDGIAVLTADDIYCTIDVPLGADAKHASHIVTRGHLEIVLPKAA